MIPDLLLYLDGLAIISGLWLFGRIRFLREGPGEAGSRPAISIIIPARNEEKNLPVLLNSITSQDGPSPEILVVDDDSSDSTASVALRCGACVITSQPLPEGWVGKAWACYQGARQATGDYLLFLDADTWLEQGGLQKIAAEAAARKGAVSLYPFHRVVRWHEELSGFFNICAITSGCGKRLFGPSLVIEREKYFASGGHLRVRGRILENLYLSEILQQQRISLASFGGRGALSFRMYPGGLRELAGGWGKAFAGGAAQAPLSGLLPVSIWLCGCADSVRRVITAAASGAAGDMAVSALLYALFSAQLYWALRRIGSFRLVTAALFPVPLAFFMSIFTWSLYAGIFRRDVVWKSRPVHSSENSK